MDLRFDVSDEDAARARAFFDQRARHPFVVLRERRNVRGDHAPVDAAEFWDALLSALLTTQQRSGPTSAVNRLISASPFPLRLEECRRHPDVAAWLEAQITSHGGIRRGPTIARAAAQDLAFLDAGGWSVILEQTSALGRNGSAATERACAQLLAANLDGIGPKQSRNVLQMLGLTRFETPLDSRVAKWLASFGFPLPVSSTLLADGAFYELVSDGFQAICAAADVLPCLMDAAIFASFDATGWNTEPVRW